MKNKCDANGEELGHTIVPGSYEVEFRLDNTDVSVWKTVLFPHADGSPKSSEELHDEAAAQHQQMIIKN